MNEPYEPGIYAAKAAADAAEALRTLNHQLPHIDHAADLYTILNLIDQTVRALPQTVAQIAARFTALRSLDRLGLDSEPGTPDSVDDAVDQIVYYLNQAFATLGGLGVGGVGYAAQTASHLTTATGR